MPDLFSIKSKRSSKSNYCTPIDILATSGFRFLWARLGTEHVQGNQAQAAQEQQEEGKGNRRGARAAGEPGDGRGGSADPDEQEEAPQAPAQRARVLVHHAVAVEEAEQADDELLPAAPAVERAGAGADLGSQLARASSRGAIGGRGPRLRLRDPCSLLVSLSDNAAGQRSERRCSRPASIAQSCAWGTSGLPRRRAWPRLYSDRRKQVMANARRIGGRRQAGAEPGPTTRMVALRAGAAAEPALFCFRSHPCRCRSGLRSNKQAIDQC